MVVSLHKHGVKVNEHLLCSRQRAACDFAFSKKINKIGYQNINPQLRQKTKFSQQNIVLFLQDKVVI